MSIMWFKENAKWVIYFFGALILLGLILMDRAGSNFGTQNSVTAGEVNGHVISSESFRQELENYRQNETARTGRSPDQAQMVRMRNDMFEYKIQSILLGEEFSKYHMRASGEEMLHQFRNNPPPEVQSSPIFHTDSVFDPQKFENWLASDSAYAHPYMRNMEQQLSQYIVPQSQLQILLRSQSHKTVLEQRYQITQQETKAKLVYYYVSTDSITKVVDTIPEFELKAFFEAHPDSFYNNEEAAQLTYVKIPIVPSQIDSNNILSLAKMIRDRATEGEDFTTLATSYSEDPGSAEQGGHLGGFQARGAWVAPFAEAAFKLDSGDISAPVLTQFGVHIIQSHGKKMEEDIEKADLSHILLKIDPSPETIDSLVQSAEEIRKAALKSGNLENVAKLNGLEVKDSPVFSKSEWTPLGGEYMAGVNSFAFSSMEQNNKVSDVLQNDEGVFLFARKAKFEKGRHFERAKENIRQVMVRDAKLQSAALELEAIKPQLPDPNSELPSVIGKAVLDSSRGEVSSESWLAGYGFSSPVLVKVFTQPINQWGTIEKTDQAACIAAVLSRTEPSGEVIEAKLKQNQGSEEEEYKSMSLFQNYLTELKSSAKVENNLDQLFRF